MANHLSIVARRRPSVLDELQFAKWQLKYIFFDSDAQPFGTAEPIADAMWKRNGGAVSGLRAGRGKREMAGRVQSTKIYFSLKNPLEK